MVDSEPESPNDGDGGGTAAAAADPATAPLDLLLEVQDRDLALDQLAYRRRELTERASVAEFTDRLAEQHVRVAETREQRDKLAAEQDKLDEHSETVGARIQAIEQRLRSGNAGSYRDEQHMGEEATSLARQRREIEDHELEVMEALEPLELELEGLEDTEAAALGELGLAREQLAIAEAAIDAEATIVRAERESLAAGLAEDLAGSYERLRSKLGGIGAARLVGGACGGCHLQLPAGELNRIKHATAGSVVYCDQCGRILVS
jgi:predicted  nucleic acid-binding Zn-ribbon protein